MLNTPAWRGLNPTARSVYVQLASRYAGVNNGRISYSVREGTEELGVGKSTIHRALTDLVDRGFIVVTKRGGFTVKLKHATEWRLTEFYCDVKQQAATKDFMRWKPEEIQNTVPVVGPKVPVVGPVGTCGGTDVAKTARNGTCGGTVEAPKSNPRSQDRTLIVYQVCEPSSASAPSRLTITPQFAATIEKQDRTRARRATKSAPASARVRGGGR